MTVTKSKNAQMDRRKFLKSVSLAGAGLGVAPLFFRPAYAQNDRWKPERTIQVVIQYSAGGGTDSVIRTLLREMEPILDQRITATNVPGALGSIATQRVMSMPADGYTWLGAGGFLDYPRIRGMSDAVTWQDFQFFQMASSIASWSTHPDSEFKNFQDVIDYAKGNPGKLRVGTDGVGGTWDEAISVIADIAGFEYSAVPFDGGAPATLAAVQREVDLTGSGLHEQIQFIKSGQLRQLATYTGEPLDLGDGMVTEPITKYVPDAAETAPYGADYNFALRRETPQNILATVSDAIEQAVASDGFQKMLSDRFMSPLFLTGEAVDKKAARLETRRAALFERVGLAERTADDLGLPDPAEFEEWWPPAGYSPTL